MAAATAVYYVSTQEYNDPAEPRPKDDQVIVFDARKDVPIKDYIEELNKIIADPKSFLYGSRISNDRICVVLASADQAKLLVEDVGKIVVNSEVVLLKYFVAKAVKIIISNALHDISNTLLKKYLVKNCGIRTLSSVAEFKTNMGPEKNDSWCMKSYRRFVYIHPDDVSKIPKGPVKFVTPHAAYNVFFELDTPRCFNCSQPGHFRANCPQNLDDSKKAEEARIDDDKREILEKDESSSAKVVNSGADVNAPASFATLFTQRASVQQKGTQLSPSVPYILPGSSANVHPSDSTQSKGPNLNAHDSKNESLLTFKRPLSSTSSEKSVFSNSRENLKSLDINQETNTTNLVKKVNKKRRLLEKKNLQERISSVTSSLESARAHIDASQTHNNIDYDKFLELLIKSCTSEPSERRSIVLSYHFDSSNLSKLITEVHGIVSGRGTKKKLTALKKAVENAPSEFSEETGSDTSQVSDSETLMEE